MKLSRLFTPISSLLVVILINILSYLFIYDKEFIQGDVEITINNEHATEYWIVYKEFFNEKRALSQRKEIQSNTTGSISMVIPANIDIEYIALAWKGIKNKGFVINEIKISNGKKTKTINNPRDFISYNSVGVSSEISDSNLHLSSLQDGSRWIMLKNQEMINKVRRIKKREFLPWYFNMLSFSILLLVFRKTNREFFRISNYKFSIQKFREVNLMIWMLLFPFWPVSSTIFLGIGVLLFLLGFKTYEKQDVFLQIKKLYWPLAIFFLIQLAKYITLDFSELELKRVIDCFVILLMPLSFICLSSKSLKTVTNITKISVIAYIIVFLVSSVNSYYSQEISTDFMEYFALRFNYFWHSSYYGSLILIILLSDYFSIKKLKGKNIILYVIFGLFLYITKARIALVLLVLGVFFLFISRFKLSKKTGIIILIPIILLTSSIVVYKIDVFKNKIESIVDNEARKYIWESSLISIKEKPFFGHGSSNVQNEVYKHINTDKNIKFRDYNSHNQFLETTTAMGIIGLISLLIILVNPFVITSNKIIMNYCILIGTLFLFESFLSRQAGVNIFAFWYCLFLNYNFNKD